jgi:hypothetical protein
MLHQCPGCRSHREDGGGGAVDGGYWADVERQVEFGRWFRDGPDAEGIHTVDTTDATVAETAATVADWLVERLEGAGSPRSGDDPTV